jgi:ABC-type thiamine transport system substrate-binding protein
MKDQKPTEGQANQPSESVRALLGEHQEALVLLLDPDTATEGESTITCFMKLGEPSRLAAYLPTLLQQLLQTSRGKTSCNISTKTTTSP